MFLMLVAPGRMIVGVTYKRTGIFPTGPGMAKYSVLETDSKGYLRAAEAPITCRNAIIFSFAERGAAGAGCCAAFAWNCSKRAFTCGSSSFNIGQFSFFRVYCLT